jgi:ribosomal RNA-processing protein 9
LSSNKKSLNEEISSDSEEDNNLGDNKRKSREEGYESSSSETLETPQEKKIRLAKKYLEDIERQEKDRNETEFIDKSVISGRLRDDILEQSGRLHRKVADNYLGASLETIRYLKNGHHLSITCIVLSSDSKFIYSSSKDCSIIKWDFETNKKLRVINGGKKGTEAKHIGHTAHILSLAISSDNKFLASGCVNKIIHIWNPETMQLIHTFRGHRGPVSGLAFRKGFHQLFSSSFDRSVKVWNLDEMSYVETLFGHQDSLTAIDSLIRERAITAGGRDSSVRIWKIAEESQLVFHGSNHSIDCVKLIDEQHFVSASDNGFGFFFISFVVLSKKKISKYSN